VNKLFRHISLFPLIITVAFLFSSCNESPYFEEYLSVGEAGWQADSTASFQVEIEDTTCSYALVFNLRANNNYPYSNLYLFRKILSEESTEYADTAQIFLADAYGRWLGDGIGALKTFQRPYRKNPLSFRKKGLYTFEFSQAMRTNALDGVEEVGLTIYKIENGQEN
jgi:gliding motility-associated lipoprotein GldH